MNIEETGIDGLCGSAALSRGGVQNKLNRPGFAGGPNSWETGVMEAKKSTNKFSSEVRELAAWMVQEHRGEYPSEWDAVAGAGKLVVDRRES